MTPTMSHCFETLILPPSHRGCARQLEAPYRGRGIGLAEDRGPRDERIRAGVPGPPDGFRGDAAVHLQRRAASPRIEEPADAADLAGRRLNVMLATVPRIHAHHQHEVEVVDHVLEQRHRRGGGQGEPRPHPLFPHPDELPLHVDRGLGVKGEPRRARRREVVDVALRLHHHEMDVEREAGEPAHRLDDRRAEGEGRYEAAVHHIHVHPLGAAPLDGGGPTPGRPSREEPVRVVIVPTRSPAASSRCRASSCFNPTTSGTRVSAGPLLTTRSILVPGGRKAPMGGRVVMMTPSCTLLTSVSTSPIRSPAASTTWRAWSSSKEATSGTGTFAGPALGVTWT